MGSSGATQYIEMHKSEMKSTRVPWHGKSGAGGATQLHENGYIRRRADVNIFDLRVAGFNFAGILFPPLAAFVLRWLTLRAGKEQRMCLI